MPPLTRQHAIPPLLVAASLAVAWLAPGFLPVWFGAPILAAGLLLAYRHLTAVWAVWVVVAGLSAEMAMADLAGPEMFQITIAAVKGGEILLVGLSMIRYGPRFDRFNPAFGFLWIAAMGTVAGVHPDLTPADMLRSLAGSIVPFLPFFCRLPSHWGRTVQRAVTFAPLVSCGIGAVLALLGLRPLFVDSGGARLAALGHPAFLAGVCLPAIYAGLLRWLRSGRPETALLTGANVTILLLTGARAPIVYGFSVVALSLLLAPHAAVPRARRLPLMAAALALLPPLLLIGEDFTSLRLFTVLSDAGHLSGRDLLWPEFEAAAARAPWFGWGLGAGNVVIPHHSQLVQLLQTWAAHNEYLRLEVEGGQIGRGLLILLFVVWVRGHAKTLPARDRTVIVIVFLAHAAHAMTDNVLISTPACVFFAFFAATIRRNQPDPAVTAEQMPRNRAAFMPSPAVIRERPVMDLPSPRR